MPSPPRSSPDSRPVRRALPWRGQPIGYDQLYRRTIRAWRAGERTVDRLFGRGDGGTIGLLLVALLFLLLLLPGTSNTADPAVPQPLAPATLSAPELARPKEQDALAPAPAGPGPATYFELQAPFEIVDAVTLRTPLMTVRLKGVMGPDGKAVCSDDWRRRWACGLRSRAALNNATRTGVLRCSAAEADAPEVEAQCATPEGDLAARLVGEGWVRPTEGGRYGAEVAEAQRERRGLWNGGWTILP